MKDEEYPRLLLPEDFDEQGSFEATLKGHLSCAEVELQNGQRYKLNFVDLNRLSQDLAHEIDLGRPFIAEEALIVVESIDLGRIRSLAKTLFDDGFFDHLKPKL